jgi:hypothetical protein
MLRKVLILGGAASLAGVAFVLSPDRSPKMSDAEVEAVRLVKLCEAGVRPARECAGSSETRRATAQARSPAVGTWADPGSAERASAAILAKTPAAPDQEPAATGSLDTPVEDATPASTGSLPAADPKSPALVPPRRVASAAPRRPEADEAARAAADPAPAPVRSSATPRPTGDPAVAPVRPAAPPRQASAPAPRALEQKPQNGTAGRAPKEAASRALAESYLDSWSADGHDAADVRRLYGHRVNFFGRSVDQQELLAQKRRFAQRWPVRNYRHRPGSLDVRCDDAGKHCRVQSILDYDAANPERGARARGSMQFELGLDVSGERPVVTSENTRRLSPTRVATSRPSADAARPAPYRLPRQSPTEEVWLEEEIDSLE